MRFGVVWLVSLMFWLVEAPVARANDAEEKRARELYSAGGVEFEKGSWKAAYDDFKQAYTISQQPALLYNIASTLQRMERPHDAAETLGSYLRLRPHDPDRPAIEERIRTLEEGQRLLDAERAAAAEHRNEGPAPTPVTAAPAPVTAAPATAAAPPPAAGSVAPNVLAEPSLGNVDIFAEPPPQNGHTAVIAVATIAAVVVVGGAISIGVGVALSSNPFPMTSLGNLDGTR